MVSKLMSGLVRTRDLAAQRLEALDEIEQRMRSDLQMVVEQRVALERRLATLNVAIDALELVPFEQHDAEADAEADVAPPTITHGRADQ